MRPGLANQCLRELHAVLRAESEEVDRWHRTLWMQLDDTVCPFNYLDLCTGLIQTVALPDVRGKSDSAPGLNTHINLRHA